MDRLKVVLQRDRRLDEQAAALKPTNIPCLLCATKFYGSGSKQVSKFNGLVLDSTFVSSLKNDGIYTGVAGLDYAICSVCSESAKELVACHERYIQATQAYEKCVSLIRMQIHQNLALHKFDFVQPAVGLSRSLHGLKRQRKLLTPLPKTERVQLECDETQIDIGPVFVKQETPNSYNANTDGLKSGDFVGAKPSKVKKNKLRNAEDKNKSNKNSQKKVAKKECPVCHKNVSRLSQHIRDLHTLPQFSCVNCERLFARKGVLAAHTKSKTRNGVLICEKQSIICKCGRLFASVCSKNNHVRKKEHSFHV